MTVRFFIEELPKYILFASEINPFQKDDDRFRKSNVANIVDVRNTAEKRAQGLLFLWVIGLRNKEAIMQESCRLTLERTLVDSFQPTHRQLINLHMLRLTEIVILTIK